MAAAARIRGPRPRRVTVRMYQVGFGDCFLVSFGYATPLKDGRSERHLLVDFGSTHGPKGARAPRPASTRPSLIERAAQRIAEHTHGQLDVIVNTHRHRDHLSGFADPEAAAIIKALNPRLVVRPWTDDPALAHDATARPQSAHDAGLHFAASLTVGQQLAARVEQLTRDASITSARGRLARLALDQVPNLPAIEFLDALAAERGASYPTAGRSSGIEAVIPGIGVRVLGPPTLDQLPDIATAREDDSAEFWLAQHAALQTLTAEQLRASSAGSSAIPPGPVGWVVDRLVHQQVGSLARIVRTVDDALNNTSLILLVDAGDKRLLLPGDAQIENWSWSLFHAPQAARYRRLLRDVDLYKVGHHGSRNATPKTLFGLWGEQPGAARPMMALLSTTPDVHGRSEATAVPRQPLVDALARRMTLVRTDALSDSDARQGYATVSAETRGAAPFALQPGAGP